MNKGTVTLIILGLGLLAGILIWIKQRRASKVRERLLRTPLSDFDREGLIENFPLYALLPEGLRDRLDGLIQLFLDDKDFEACGGLKSVSPEMRLTIAAQACLLLAGHELPKGMPYPKLRSVLVYPDAYRASEDGKSDSVRLGESWDRGTIVLAWASVQRGGQIGNDGHNVTMHEFAHQLDSEDRVTDGAPPLENARAYQAWSAAFSGAWERFVKRVDKGQPTVIDEYGATNHAEFFAVCVETFFEKPLQLKRRYPKVYEEMRHYFQLDPLDWI